MSTATIIQKNYVNMLPNNKVMLKNKTKFEKTKFSKVAGQYVQYHREIRLRGTKPSRLF